MHHAQIEDEDDEDELMVNAEIRVRRSA